MNMGPDKRGNPPFDPSSYAAGLERRVKRLTRWSSRAREAARWLLNGTEHQKQFAEQWWREQLEQPRVVASVDTLPKGGDAARGSVRSKGGAVPSDSEGDAQP